MTARLHLAILGIAFMPLSAQTFGQGPSAYCDAMPGAPADCGFVSRSMTVEKPSQNLQAKILGDKDPTLATGTIALAPEPVAHNGFHWGPALQESFTFLAIEQAYVVKDDFRWVIVENGIPFNHYWRDYMQSLSSWWKAGWSAGENPLYNYVGHPIQGAMTSYIEIQNDPRGENLEFANTKEYWRSRLMATIWNTVYSTQWSMGPLSEMTVEKYGTKARPPWNSDGSWPCTSNHCYSGVGKVNIVITPVGGLGWVLAEDWLDKNAVRRLEDSTSNRLLINAVRCSLNPIRGGASILHGRAPWYRARDHGSANLIAGYQYASPPANGLVATPAPTANPRVPDVWNVFAGYSYTNSDVVTGAHTHLGGWNVALEKKYLHFLGVVGDISGQYGSSNVTASTCHSTGSSTGGCVTTASVSQYNYLTGIRGGYSVWRIHPYAQALVGAAHTHQRTSGPSTLDTFFTFDFGVGLDFRLAARVGWRMQADYLTAGNFEAQGKNVRLSIGPAIRF